MRITYKKLAEAISKMTVEQQNSDVTVELEQYGESNECYAGSLEICSDNHDSLDDGHPVIFVDYRDETIKFT